VRDGRPPFGMETAMTAQPGPGQARRTSRSGTQAATPPV